MTARPWYSGTRIACAVLKLIARALGLRSQLGLQCAAMYGILDVFGLKQVFGMMAKANLARTRRGGGRAR